MPEQVGMRTLGRASRKQLNPVLPHMELTICCCAYERHH